MRLLVTGGAGFIGSHIAEMAAYQGIDVAVLDNLISGSLDNLPRGMRFYHADIRDELAIERVFTEFKPEVVCHQAAQVSVSASIRDPLLDASANITGTLVLLEACRRHGVKRFVLASTGGAIYGEVDGRYKANVRSATNPQSPYAVSKLACERYLLTYAYHHHLQPFILRYANVYGPRQNPHGEAGVVAIFCHNAVAERPMRVYGMHKQGDPGCVRDYVFVRDVARANLAAIEGCLRHTIVNVCTGRPTTTLKLIRMLEHWMGRAAIIEYAPPRPGDLRRSVLDAAPFIQQFGMPTPLRAGLAETMHVFGSEPVETLPRTDPVPVDAAPYSHGL